MDSAIILFTVILSAMLTSLAWLIVYEEYTKDIEQDLHEYNEKIVSKKIAGHKSAHTRIKKNYEIAKKIIRRGRDDS